MHTREPWSPKQLSDLGSVITIRLQILSFIEFWLSKNFASVVTPHTNVSCENEKAWEFGATFFNYLNSVSIEGITGKIRFQVSLSLKF